MTKLAVRETTGDEVQAGQEAGEAVRLVDVREHDEWEQSHIPGVLLLPLSEFAARCQGEIDPNDAIVCICEHGVRSRRAGEYLLSLGYKDVATMTGGMSVYPGPTASAAELTPSTAESGAR